MASPDSDEIDKTLDTSEDASANETTEDSLILDKKDASEAEDTSSSALDETGATVDDEAEEEISDTSVASAEKLKEILEANDDSDSKDIESEHGDDVEEESKNDGVNDGGTDEVIEDENDKEPSDTNDEGKDGKACDNNDEQIDVVQDEITEEVEEIKDHIKDEEDNEITDELVQHVANDFLEDDPSMDIPITKTENDPTDEQKSSDGGTVKQDEDVKEKIEDKKVNIAAKREQSETNKIIHVPPEKSDVPEKKTIADNELKELEKSVESISNVPENADTLPKRSPSFEASVEKMLSDNEENVKSPQDGNLSGDTTSASDMEKYMETNTKQKQKVKKSENGQRQKEDSSKSDRPRQLTDSVRFSFGAASDTPGTSDQKLTQVSLSDSGTDSLHSMEESDHFKNRKKPAVPLDPLRSDPSSSEASQSKSNNHHKTSYGSINIPTDSTQEACCRCSKCYPTGCCLELGNINGIAWSMFFMQFFLFLFGPVALMYIGHHEPDEFLGVALALSVINVTGISVAIGLGNACDSVFFQLHKSGHREDIVIALQRGVIFAILTIMPCYAIHLNAESILLAIGFEPSICSITADFLLVFTPGLLAFFLYVLVAKFIQNQRKVYFVLWVGLTSNLLNVMLHFVLVFEMDLGPRGSAICLTITYIFMLLLSLIYLFWAGLVRNNFSLGWRSESFQDWGSFFLIAFPSIISTCAEWWTVEIGLFLAGLLGMKQLGAQAILVQIEIICYMFSLGVATATTIRISQSLRVGQADRAKTLSRVALTMSVFVGVILVALLIALHSVLPLIFNPRGEITDLASSTMPLVCLYIFCDCFLVVCGGIFRGCGRFFLGGIIAVLGLIASVVLGVVLMVNQSLELKGWWIAIGAVSGVEAILCILINLFTNWENQVKQAKKRFDLLMSTSRNGSYGKPTEKAALLAAKEKDFTASYDDYYSRDFDFQASYEHPTRTYSGTHHLDSQRNSEQSKRKSQRGLSTWQLVLRRGSVILLFVGILAAGIVFRLLL